jgi:RHS repeat-associated protein
VGGLLAVTDSSGTYFATFDANGNVSEYLDSTGAIAAHYEYDPFGGTTVATGAKATDFSHRFSTKFLDPETGLYYYGYRYLDTETGRWLSRDPIHERGGFNLYAFVSNDPADRIDPRGLVCGVVVKRITADVTGRTDKYGHEWIEVGGGTSSYGWWPIKGVTIWDALFGVPGAINRGRPQDPHNMDVSDITWETEIETRTWVFFSRKLGAGRKAGTPCKCASCGDILDCLDSFAGNHAGRWAIWRSCRTFSKRALSACCLEKGKKTVTTRTYTVP